MGTRVNRHYNNPMIGAAFENLSSLFAPPAPQDVMAYAQAAKARKEQEGLESLYGLAGDPNADPGALDRWGAATGAWNPTQGFGARDMADATERHGIGVASADRRYGVDVGAETSRANNLLSTQAGVVGDLFGPLNPGQVRPSVDEEIMGTFNLPGVGGEQGLPKPLSESEVEGQLLTDAIAGGMVGPQDAATAYRSDIPVEQIVGEGGDPLFVNRGDAVGAQPYVNPGSQPAMRFVTYKTPDGQTGTAILNPVDGSAVDQSSRQPLPPGSITGDVIDEGGGALTSGVQSDFDRRAFALTGALSTIDSLNEMVASNPSSQGAVGALRGTAQDIMQTGTELGRAFGGTIAEVNDAVANGMIDAGVATQMYDPAIPAIDMMMNVLAWQYAKSMGGDRVSNEQLRMARSAIGDSGVFANQASTMTRLGELRRMLSEEGQRLIPNLSPQLQSDLDVRLRNAPAAPGAISNAPAAAPGVPPPGTTEDGYRFKGGDPSDPANWERVQ